MPGPDDLSAELTDATALAVIRTNPDGTFLSPSKLRELYAAHGVAAGRPVVTYCRIGGRSAHTWLATRAARPRDRQELRRQLD